MLLVVVHVASVFLAVAPEGCGSRVMMYTGAGYGAFGWVSLASWLRFRRVYQAGLLGQEVRAGRADLMAVGAAFGHFCASVGGPRHGESVAVGYGWCLWAPVVVKLRPRAVGVICARGGLGGLAGYDGCRLRL